MCLAPGPASSGRRSLARGCPARGRSCRTERPGQSFTKRHTQRCKPARPCERLCLPGQRVRWPESVPRVTPRDSLARSMSPGSSLGLLLRPVIVLRRPAADAPGLGRLRHPPPPPQSLVNPSLEGRELLPCRAVRRSERRERLLEQADSLPKLGAQAPLLRRSGQACGEEAGGSVAGSQIIDTPCIAPNASSSLA